jgi:hypothetical protein
LRQSQSPLDTLRGTIEQWVTAGYSTSEIINALAHQHRIKTSRRSLDRAFRRWSVTPNRHSQEVEKDGPLKPGFSLDGDNAEATSPTGEQYVEPEAIMREYGLDPADWEVRGLRLNNWNSPTGEVLRQVRVSLTRVRPLKVVLPAEEAASYRRTGMRYKRPHSGPELIVFVGDHQAPYVNWTLHELFCQWVEENSPTRGVIMGDLVDFPDISRHPENPEWHVGAQECVNSGYKVLHEVVAADARVEWHMLMGNHDERIRSRLLSHQTNLYALRPAQRGEEREIPIWHLSRLLHLEDLGINLIEPNGKYTHAQYMVSPHLAARHGHVVRKGSGSSALGTLEEFGFSMVVGHTHRQSIVHKTTHDINGHTTTLAGVETGCMCRIEEGLGYTPAPDWQNGFATASVWPDGTFKIDLATFVNDTLYWRDQRYS